MKTKTKKSDKKQIAETPKKSIGGSQAFWFFLVIIVVLSSVILAPYLYHEIFGKFDYAKIPFEKIKYSQLDFYQGTFPVIYQGKFYHYYLFYLRTDPRDNAIPINTNITLSQKVSISLDKEVGNCGSSMILAQTEFGKFIKVFPWVKNTSSGVTDLETAKLYNLNKIDCSNASEDHSVFIVQKSETPSIDAGNKSNCFILNVGECKNLETMERLIVGSLAQINGLKI